MRPSPPREPERPHVLVVDDEPEIRDLLRTVLTREGYRVTIRGEANAALEDLRDGDHVLLITDLKMPRMSGLDLIRAARNLRPDLGSILITGFASTETAVEALRLGADDFLPKPFQIDVLRRVVDRVLQRRRMLTQERDALDLARGETEALRRRSRETRTRLESVERDLALSRAELQRRVRDLDFMGDLTSLLAREDDVTRVLATTVRILAARFSAQVVRIEVAGPDGVHIAEHVEPGVTRALWASLGPHLVGRARGEPDALVRETLLADGRPWEAFAATVELAHGPAGSMTLLREAPREEDPGDRFLFGLVRRALAVGLDAELGRREAMERALRVATGILEALEGRGALPPGHAVRVARLSVAVADELGLSPRLREVVRTAARLHDVGEVGVPDDVLTRKGPLTPREKAVIRSHPVLGARILAPFGEAAAFVRHHHERPDGEGYPDGLAAEAIPTGAAIIGAVEAYDAMTHHRAWRPSRPRAEALAEIEGLKGRQFVPDVADALARVARREHPRW